VEKLGWTIVGFGILSILVYVAVPSIGHEKAVGYETAMRGVFAHKNTMSECMLLGLCCFCFAVVKTKRLSIKNGAAIGLILLCIVLGKGASSLLVGMVVVTIAGLMALRDRPVGRLAVVFAVVWCVTAAALTLLVAPEVVFAAAGRDPTLTGRLPLWQALAPEIMRHPILGYGYAGFWIDDSRTVQHVWRLAGWQAPDAHSSYLDILLQLGIVGLALYAWLWARMAYLAKRALQSGFGSARWVILYSIALLLISLDEGPLSIADAWTMMIPVAMLALSSPVPVLQRNPPGQPLFSRVYR
jgi:O-antigen ligase